MAQRQRTMGQHKKHQFKVALGEWIECGSRKFRIDAEDTTNTPMVLDVTIAKKKGETVEVRHPNRMDVQGGWIMENPGEGPVVEVKDAVTIGHKVRLGDFRQFRVIGKEDGKYVVNVIGLKTELPAD